MATYSLSGIAVIWASDDVSLSPTFVSSKAALALYTPTGITQLRYTNSDQGNGTFLSDLNVDGSALYLDGRHFDDDSGESVIAEMTWMDGGSTRSTTVLIIDRGAEDGIGHERYLFALDGDPLPALTVPLDWQTFNASISALDPATGALAPEIDIPLVDILQNGPTTNDIQGTEYGDDLRGTQGDDMIMTGNDMELEGDYVQTRSGNDTVVMTDNTQGFVMLSQTVLNAGITVTVDGATNTGSIDKGVNGITTLKDPNNPGSLRFFGTTHDDVFNVSARDDGWVALRGNAGNDTFNLSGDVRLDYIDAGTAAVTVRLDQGLTTNDGYGGQDSINGAVWELRTGMGDDMVVGSDNDERFILRGGNDTLNAGGGIDLLRYDNAGAEQVIIDLGAGAASGRWSGQAFNHSFSGVEQVYGSRNGNDHITGNDAANVIDAFAGDDTLIGGNGDDKLDGGFGADSLMGGGDNDSLRGDTGADTLKGEEGNDTLRGDSSTDMLMGGAGDDSLTGGTGDDTLHGGSGDDRLFGNTARDTLYGNEGNDYISAGDGVDWVDGGSGNDTIHGRSGWDSLYGGDGDDSLYGSSGDDYISGGRDNDWISGGSAWDQLFGNSGDDTLYGNFGSDVLSGGSGNDALYGGTGDDTLRGISGDDLLQGNQGVDVLEGGTGNDTLRGGTLSDTFIFTEGDDQDVIEDFRLGEDILALDSGLTGGVTDTATVVADFTALTAAGAVMDFGDGDTLLLEGITTAEQLDALTDDITFL